MGRLRNLPAIVVAARRSPLPASADASVPLLLTLQRQCGNTGVAALVAVQRKVASPSTRADEPVRLDGPGASGPDRAGATPVTGNADTPSTETAGGTIGGVGVADRTDQADRTGHTGGMRDADQPDDGRIVAGRDRPWEFGDVVDWTVGFGDGLRDGIVQGVVGAGAGMGLLWLAGRVGLQLTGAPAIGLLLAAGVLAAAHGHYSAAADTPTPISWPTALLGGVADLANGTDLYQAAGTGLAGQALDPGPRGAAFGRFAVGILFLVGLAGVVRRVLGALAGGGVGRLAGTVFGPLVERLAPIARRFAALLELAGRRAPAERPPAGHADARGHAETGAARQGATAARPAATAGLSSAAADLRAHNHVRVPLPDRLSPFAAEIRAHLKSGGDVPLPVGAAGIIAEYREQAQRLVREAYGRDGEMADFGFLSRAGREGVTVLHVDGSSRKGLHLTFSVGVDRPGTVRYPGLTEADVTPRLGGRSMHGVDELPGVERLTAEPGDLVGFDRRNHVHSTATLPDANKTLLLIFDIVVGE